MASFVPAKSEAILEPAAGNGALLKALVSRLTAEKGRIVIVDSDREALAQCRRIAVPPGWLASLHCGDYISLRLDQMFDCVIMNPPFAARGEKYLIKNFEGVDCSYPIEVAFVIKTLRALREGGRMIGLLPASLINADAYRWLRHGLGKEGTLKIVHELPERTFPTADVKTYMVVFDKAKTQKPLRLWNHSLNEPEELLISPTADRLDFSFYEAQRELKRLKQKTEIEWREIREIVLAVRGHVLTPTKRFAIHTTDYRAGFWKSQRTHNPDFPEKAATSKDILVKRVSRRCATTFGFMRGSGAGNATDCVLILKPKKGVSQEELLFSLRVFFGWKWARCVLERGAAASYISLDALNSTEIPVNLPKIAKKNFSQYRRALKKYDFQEMQKIESDTRVPVRKNTSAGNASSANIQKSLDLPF